MTVSHLNVSARRYVYDIIWNISLCHAAGWHMYIFFQFNLVKDGNTNRKEAKIVHKLSIMAM